MIDELTLIWRGAVLPSPSPSASPSAPPVSLHCRLGSAHDGGYFAREGVPAELIYIRGGPQTMSALISGEVPFAQIYGGALVAAGLTGADIVIVAGLINSPFFSIVTIKGIDKPEDLRGKKIGISTFGSATDFALRLALKKWGLKADSEVSILADARRAGNFAGDGLRRASRRRDVSTDQYDGDPSRFQRARLSAANRHLVPAHHVWRRPEDISRKTAPVALKVLRAYIAAIERIKADKAFTLKTLSKYMSTTGQGGFGLQL